MLATDKIAGAFKAIVEEAEKIRNSSPGEEIAAAAKSIISIARHQSDIRGAKGSECKAHHSCKSKG